MRRRLAIVALSVAATLPAARLVGGARAQQAPAAQPPTAAQAPSSQNPPAPAGQASKPAQEPGKPVPKPFPTPEEKQAPPEKAPDPGALVFASNAGILFSPIKPDQEAAFEEILGRVQEALAKSVDPVRKQQAAGWKVYKSTEPFQGSTLYISVMDPVVKDASYNVFPILQEGYGDVAAREMFEKFRNAHAGGQNLASMNPILLMSSGKVALPVAK